ncbi:MAG: hypothetical protein AAFP90_24280, partial [Planctomycetota bacterium]
MTTYQQMTQQIDAIEKMGDWIFESGMFGCKKKGQGRVIAMELFSTGTSPMEYQKRNMLVSGRPSIPYDAQIAAFQERGGKLKVIEKSPDAARIELTYQGETTPFALTWEDAAKEPFVYNGKEADVIKLLANGKNPQVKAKYATPRSRAQMLYARVISDAIRTVAAEVNFGAYTPEEISDFDEVQQPEKPADMLPEDGPPMTANELANVPDDAQSNAPRRTTAEPAPEPATESQRQQVLDRIAKDKTLKPLISNKIKASGIDGGVRGLTYHEADSLIAAIDQQMINLFLDMPLKGIEKKA